MITFMISSLKGLRLKWITGILLFILESLALLGTVFMQKFLIDNVFISGQYDILAWVISGFAACYIVYICLFTAAPLLLNHIGYDLRMKLTLLLMSKIHRVTYLQLQKERVGNVVNYFSNDVHAVSDLIALDIPMAVRQVFTVCFLIIIISIVSPLILIVVLLSTAFYIYIGKIFAVKLNKVTREVQEKRGAVLNHIEESLSSTREVLAFTRESWEQNRYNQIFGHFFTSIMREGKLVNRQYMYSEFFKWLINIFILAFGGYMVVKGRLTVGYYVVIYQFSSQLMTSFQDLFNMMMTIFSKTAFVQRLKQELSIKQVEEGRVLLNEPVKSIKFDRVWYQIEDSRMEVLKEITFDIPVGQKIAIVGESGSGKSTIISLLLKFLEPTTGGIWVNGILLSDIQRSSWSRKVHVVFQEPYFFPDDIRNNLIIGREHVTDQLLINVCKVAMIYDFIETLPEGFNTVLGERGITLSGGQRQRLAIARAILDEPEVLILDEATSALDLETERQIQKNLDTIRKGLTTIIVAHRLSTIKNADVMHVVKDGKIMESGNHEQLLANQSVYLQLMESNITKGVV